MIVNRIRPTFVAIACLLAATGVDAQLQTIRVRVVDEPTRFGVAQATVELKRDSQRVASATTDTLGFVELSVEARAEYSLVVTALGYVTQSRPLDLRMVV